MLSTMRMNSAAVSMQYMTTNENDVEGQHSWGPSRVPVPRGPVPVGT